MADRVDLVYLGSHEPPSWQLGAVFQVLPTPRNVSTFIQQQLIMPSRPTAWFFWSDKAGELPSNIIDVIPSLLDSPIQVWHAGLRCGLQRKPRIIDFVYGTWVMNSDPSTEIEVTSWRLSLNAALIKVEVIAQLGNLLVDFQSLDAAALELGYRILRNGGFIRYTPEFLKMSLPPVNIPFIDEWRFAQCCVPRLWTVWAWLRSVTTGHTTLTTAISAVMNSRQSKSQQFRRAFVHPESNIVTAEKQQQVTVLIPTINRYPYLRTLLNQLRGQTYLPSEIIIVDQTELESRDLALADDFADLPLRVFYLDEPGQCRSRNLGLQASSGDFILFIDDDDEIPSDFIEYHLKNLNKYNADVSSGVVYVPAQSPTAAVTDRVRMSDVFPTNNTMVRRKILEKSGLFDLAFDRRARADGDLGVRIYLAGALSILDERFAILHHHAPVGGLRTHKARAVTRYSSRKTLTQRHLPTASEFYLGLRYFDRQRVREAWLGSMFASLSGEGSKLRRLLRLVLCLFLLPDTYRRIQVERRKGESLLNDFPQIPTLAPVSSEPK